MFTYEELKSIDRLAGSPTFIYSEEGLKHSAAQLLAFPHAFGLCVRFAMKACPSKAVLQLMNEAGVHIDASSGYEARRAMMAGIPASHIQLTAQEYPHGMEELFSQGVVFNACSLYQLEEYGKKFPGTHVSVRINPGLGSGHSNRTNVGGPSSSFGIWKDLIPDILDIAKKYNLTIHKMHTHIGSGSDPEVWKKVSLMSLEMVKLFPDVCVLNLGGGFKVGRMPDEKTTDIQAIGEPIKQAFIDFAAANQRKLKLEIEPGTYMVANNGWLLSRVIDKVHTGAQGYTFLKVNTGMTEITRPSLYGANHPIYIISAQNRNGTENLLVAGHCCESGDILTPEPGNPEGLGIRALNPAEIGDYCLIGGAGAYCSGMSTKNYNSFPEAAEVMWHKDGTFRIIRKRQTLEQIVANETL